MIKFISTYLLKNLSNGVKNKIRAALPLSIKRYLGKKLVSDLSSHTQTVEIKDGRVFKVIDERLFLRIFFEGEYEPDLTKIAGQLVKPGDVAIDIGANFGWYTTLFGKMVAGNGKVFAFEPAPKTYDTLTDNISHNNLEETVKARKLCLGASKGALTLKYNEVDSGIAHVGFSGSSSGVEVPLSTLDDEVTEFVGDIAYVKVDVEGYELEVLLGAENILSVKNKPIIQIELNDIALSRAGTSREEVLSLLAGYGYKFYFPTADGRLLTSSERMYSDVFCAAKGVYGDRINKYIVAYGE